MVRPLTPSYALAGRGMKSKPEHTCCHAEDSFEQPDEDGAELAKDARVWKVYVKETDQWDAEQVDGWNKSLDVMLVFAALFSAVSTTFLIESSAMLKQDAGDVSAAALLAISKALTSIATNSSSSSSLSETLNQGADAFAPTSHAILINTLWYFSLSLSIATSFLAMLAKDWCHSFYSNRTGHPYEQAQRRQRKWMMVERWKMQEVILMLPFLMHLSLFLFAIGLCIYVWDLNFTPAVPVLCVTAAALAFHLWSSIASIILEHFPYTTIISRIYRWPFNIRDQRWNDAYVISHSLGWLIQNCETPRSVAIALQSIAGATSKIPKGPLNLSQASLGIFQRLVSIDPENRKIANTYARALKYLRSDSPSLTYNSGSEIGSEIKVFIWNYKLEHEKELVSRIQDEKEPNFEPTEANLNALSAGNIATMNSIRTLDGDCRDAANALNTIASMLFGPSNLHPVAFKALINAASLLVSCSMVSEVSLKLARLCIENQLDQDSETNSIIHKSAIPGQSSVSGAVLVLYVLMRNNHRMERQRDDLNKFKAYFWEKSQGLLKEVFAKKALWGSKHWKNLLWLECTKLLSSPDYYRIERYEDFIPLENWCHQHLTDFLSLLLVTSSPQGSQGFAQEHAVEFLEAIDQVYGFGKGDALYRVPEAWSRAEPLYALLTTIMGCVQPSDHRVPLLDWSKAPFPKLTSALVKALNITVSGPDPKSTIVSMLGSNLRNDSVDYRVRHFSAIQLWLLLYLVGDANTCDQKSLKRVLERDSGLEIEAKGMNHISRNLADDIIKMYRSGHHLALYSCRTIECIFQAYGTEGYEDVAQYTEFMLRTYFVAPNLRGLSSFSPPATTPAIIPTTTPATMKATNNTAISVAAPIATYLPSLIPLPPSPVSSFTESDITLRGTPKITEEREQVNHVSVEIVPRSRD